MKRDILFREFINFMERHEPDCDNSEYYEEYFEIWLAGYGFAGGIIE